jgi:hypothetical protein
MYSLFGLVKTESQTVIRIEVARFSTLDQAMDYVCEAVATEQPHPGELLFRKDSLLAGYSDFKVELYLGDKTPIDPKFPPKYKVFRAKYIQSTPRPGEIHLGTDKEIYPRLMDKQGVMVAQGKDVKFIPDDNEVGFSIKFREPICINRLGETRFGGECLFDLLSEISEEKRL